MSLNPTDLELIERVIYKNGDDIAVSIGRSFERLEERIDAAESRIVLENRGGGRFPVTPKPPVPEARRKVDLPQRGLRHFL